MGAHWQKIPILEKWTIKHSSLPSCWQKGSSAYPANTAAIPVNVFRKEDRPIYSSQIALIPCFLPRFIFMPYFYWVVTTTHALCQATLLPAFIILLNKQNLVASIPFPIPCFYIKKRTWKPVIEELTFESILREWRFIRSQIKVTPVIDTFSSTGVRSTVFSSISSPVHWPTSTLTGNDIFFKFKETDSPQHKNR